MAFVDDELSTDSARPIELYEISYTGNYWYYTSADQDFTIDGRIYQSLPISRAEIEPSIDTNKSGLPVTFPATVGFAEIFRIHPPSEVVLLKLRVQNVMSAEGDFIVAWQGRIIACDVKDPWVEVTTENVSSSLNRPGLRRLYSRRCPYALYGAQCGVVRSDYRETTPCLGIEGITIFAQSAVGKPDDHYAGGYATWENSVGGNVEKRMIRSSVGATGALTLSSFPIGLAGNAQLEIFPGCDHAITTCHGKFNNQLNYGGTPYIPTKNPFTGSTLY